MVLDEIDPGQRRRLMGLIRRAIAAPIPIDVLVTDRAEFEARKDVNGSSYYWPAREGWSCMSEPRPDVGSESSGGRRDSDLVDAGDRRRERMSDVGGVTSTFTQVLSDDAVYEYRADRWWAEGPRLAFVGCNPSLITWQAGARLDPTSANCEAIARRDGYAGVTMLNLWALRGTDPRELRGHPDPIGPGWAEAFDEAVRDLGFVVGAWGTAPFSAGTRVARRRIADVVDRLDALGLEVRCLGQTADGQPRHLSLRGVSRGALPALQPFVGRTTRPQ